MWNPPQLKYLSDLFRFPFFRDVYLGFGMCDISKESIHHICTKENGGNVAVIVVGGASESLDARPGSSRITLKRRKGFIRMALLTWYNFIIFALRGIKKKNIRQTTVKVLYSASALLTLDKSGTRLFCASVNIFQDHFVCFAT